MPCRRKMFRTPCRHKLINYYFFVCVIHNIIIILRSYINMQNNFAGEHSYISRRMPCRRKMFRTPCRHKIMLYYYYKLSEARVHHADPRFAYFRVPSRDNLKIVIQPDDGAAHTCKQCHEFLPPCRAVARIAASSVFLITSSLRNLL